MLPVEPKPSGGIAASLLSVFAATDRLPLSPWLETGLDMR